MYFFNSRLSGFAWHITIMNDMIKHVVVVIVLDETTVYYKIIQQANQINCTTHIHTDSELIQVDNFF